MSMSHLRKKSYLYSYYIKPLCSMYDVRVHLSIKGELRLKILIFLHSFLVFYYHNAVYNVS